MFHIKNSQVGDTWNVSGEYKNSVYLGVLSSLKSRIQQAKENSAF